MTNKIKNILVKILFFSIIIGFFLGNIIKKDEKISVAERRKLTSFPEFSVSNLLNGTFFSKFDSFVWKKVFPITKHIHYLFSFF